MTRCVSGRRLPAIQQISLACHPSCPRTHVRSLEVRVAPTTDGALRLTYTLTAALDQLRLVDLDPEQSRDPLWKHTCFEAFVARQGEARYREFNFAPNLDWAAYAFARRRERVAFCAPSEARVSVEIVTCRLTLEAVVPRETLLDGPPGGSLMVGLSAVLEDKSGAHSYWALCHPPGPPDFHDPESFVLVVEDPILGTCHPERGGPP